MTEPTERITSGARAGSDAPIIVVVDDIESARLVCERRLRQAGYRVIAVANEVAALEALMYVRAACVIADWDLGRGGGDGLNLLVKVGRSRKQCGRILWCGSDYGCELAEELGIKCVSKGDNWPALFDAIAAELGDYRWGMP